VHNYFCVYGLLIHNNTFLKCLTGYTDDGGYENSDICFDNNKIKDNEELMLVILNST